MTRETLSVVIPTRDRADAVRRTLDGLAEQLAEIDQVVVVDDGSSHAFATSPQHRHFVQSVRTGGLGLNRARNLGIESTTTSLVALLDDDVIVQEGWARAVRRAFSDPLVAFTAGRITLPPTLQVPRWLDLDKWGGYLSLTDPRTSRGWVAHLLPTGANCAFRRATYDRSGGFRDGLDRDGVSLVSGGETEFFARLQDGDACWFEPGMWVHHDVGDERLTFEYLSRRAYGQGLTDGRVHGPTAAVSWPRRLGLRALAATLPGRRGVDAGLYAHYLDGRSTAERP